MYINTCVSHCSVFNIFNSAILVLTFFKLCISSVILQYVLYQKTQSQLFIAKCCMYSFFHIKLLEIFPIKIHLYKTKYIDFTNDMHFTHLENPYKKVFIPVKSVHSSFCSINILPKLNTNTINSIHKVRIIILVFNIKTCKK